MKILFAIIAVLIVRLNAQSNAAVTQANQIFSSLQNQISQNVIGSLGRIEERLGQIPALHGLNKMITTIEKGLSGQALTQFKLVAETLATINVQIPEDLLGPAIDSRSQVADLLNPFNKALNFPYTNEECFTNVIPRITGNATEAVKKAELETTKNTNAILKTLDNMEKKLNDQQYAILDEAAKCPNTLASSVTCLAPLVSDDSWWRLIKLFLFSASKSTRIVTKCASTSRRKTP